jgi:hypothetical protein
MGSPGSANSTESKDYWQLVLLQSAAERNCMKEKKLHDQSSFQVKLWVGLALRNPTKTVVNARSTERRRVTLR